ncbi:cobalamin biosynthesis protein CbiG [Sporotomaculum syntrophicum]|uniref:Cobalamin biosynthesis protein CbiG n=1 Tax=Sporotomaculum syntrophicum TaxID=182264 RepID=A0A9D3AVS4_9FIRM|nr:cobalt-precorrin 5A hydrolase [Sporotomaculum syntrophicum]KAF1084505.1 cobalamin biosynthesis protein CbiG [Sporotomaculum syntrophicum]
MKVAVIALTKNGIELAGKIGRELDADLYVQNVDFLGLVEKIFYSYDALIFVMACGIVVRSIAPYIKDKQSDPAVVVVDELGRFTISLLSGHIGGANRLAVKVAAVTGGTPVITTATDINGVLAFDELATDNDCAIENIDELKYISSELVNGGKVSLFSDCRLDGTLPGNIDTPVFGQYCRFAVALTNCTMVPVTADRILYLRPRNLIIGIGCKKGKSKQEIEEAVVHFLGMNNKSLLSVKCVASISMKANEQGILDFCCEKNIPFNTFSTEEIKTIEHRFSSSNFVKNITGVGCVAEACAILAGNRPKLICPKTAYRGITLALAEEEKVITIRTYPLVKENA